MTSGYNTFKDDDNKPVSGDERYMREALKEAQFAFEEEEVPIGAVVVWNGRIIARGHNMNGEAARPVRACGNDCPDCGYRGYGREILGRMHALCDG